MHDELKLEASDGVVYVCPICRSLASCPHRKWLNSAAEAIAMRTLPPANTEADVGRAEYIIGETLEAFPIQKGEGFVFTYRQAVEAVQRALSLTRPAGGEEVERAVYEAWGCCDSAQAAVEYVRSTLTPTEGSGS